MKTLILAALTVLSLGVGVANAITANSGPAPVRQDTTSDWANG